MKHSKAQTSQGSLSGTDAGDCTTGIESSTSESFDVSVPGRRCCCAAAVTLLHRRCALLLRGAACCCGCPLIVQGAVGVKRREAQEASIASVSLAPNIEVKV